MATPGVDPRLPNQPCGVADCENAAEVLFKVSDKQEAWICRSCIPDILKAKSILKNQIHTEGADPRDDPGRPAMIKQEPFHGDPHLQGLVNLLIPEVALFVETGTGAGSSLKWVAEQYPWLLCWSCEAHYPTAKKAQQYTITLNNVHIFDGLSTELLALFQNQMPGLITRRGLFWLDAHSHGFGCTLLEEIEAIQRLWRGGFILIDDFVVPGKPEFGYDVNEDLTIGWDYVKPAIDQSKFRGLWGPNYEARSQDRGWGLIGFGELMDGAVDRLNTMEY